MKEIQLETLIDDCSAELYFEALYGDEAIRVFHAAVNKDPAARAGPWVGGERAVEFVMPMSLPAMLKKFVGVDAIAVVEKQRLEWGPGRASLAVASEPQLNFPGAANFTTSGCCTVTNLPGDKARVVVTMRCSTSIPWPMASTVEGTMAAEATSSIGTFLDWCKTYYVKWRAQQRTAAAAPAPAAAAAGEVGEQFYDALEAEGSIAAAAEAEEAVVPYVAPRLEDLIMDSLRAIQASSAETAALLRQLLEVSQHMDGNIQALRASVGGRRGAAAAAASGRTAAPGYGGLLSAGLAVSALVGTAAFVYMRQRRARG